MTAPGSLELPLPLQPLRLRCFEYQGRVKGGRTASHRVVARGEDGRAVNLVLKLREPGPPEGDGHYRGTSLAAELVCAILARACGLAVPDYAIAEVSPIFVGGIPIHAQDAHELLQRNAGPNFGSVRLQPQPLTWDPDCRLTSLELRQKLDDVISFDSAVMNGDRKRENPNLLWDGGSTVHVIDHGLACMAYIWPPAIRASSPLLPDPEVQKHCSYTFLRGQACTFDQVGTRWAIVASDRFWASVRAVVPPEWERRPGDLDAMFDFLASRVTRTGAITSELRRIVR